MTDKCYTNISNEWATNTLSLVKIGMTANAQKNKTHHPHPLPLRGEGCAGPLPQAGWTEYSPTVYSTPLHLSSLSPSLHSLRYVSRWRKFEVLMFCRFFPVVIYVHRVTFFIFPHSTFKQILTQFILVWDLERRYTVAIHGWVNKNK